MSNDGSLARPETEGRRPHFAWWRRLRQAAPWETESSARLPVVKRNASPHLKWAKKVHTQQKAWLLNHRQLCKPLPKVKAALADKGNESTTGFTNCGECFGVPLYGSVFRWATGLRVDRQEIVATEAEEQRQFHQRRSDGLLKLRQAQRKWRQCQRQSQRKRRQQTQERTLSEAKVSPARGRSHKGKYSSSRLEASQTLLPLETLEEERNQSQDRPSTSESLVSTSSEEGNDEAPRLPAMVLQKALLRRNSLQRTELMNADISSAKNVISSDVNLAELFDAGEEETEEDKKNKQLASLNGDYMASKLISRTEERPPASEEAKIEPADASLLKEQFVARVRLRSEEWRTEFPVEVLNQLTAAYESWRDEDGLRTVSLRSLNHVLRYLLGWPSTVLQHVLEAPPPERLCFQNLRDFLELVRHALEEAELEAPDVLWSEWDLNLVRESFRKYSSKTSNTMPVVNLFQAIEVLGFPELKMNTSDQQRWLAQITKAVLARKEHRKSPVEISRRESWAPPPNARAGLGAHLTFRDFLRIASRALRDAEKENRRHEFQTECEVIRCSSFGVLQVEDMRELHGSFCALKISMVGKANCDTMQELLQRITQQSVDSADLQKLRTLLRPTDAKGRESKEAQQEPVPFVTFLRWMRDIREMGIEGFSSLFGRRGSDITMEELEKRRGFHIAVLKEQLALFLESGVLGS